jgi:hypothetical protein
MVAQEWNGRKLNSSVYFEPDDQGLDLFSAYLKSIKHEPVRLLVDLIEEEFRQIKIPLLRGGDRQEIIERNFTKFFRNARYRYAQSQRVKKKDRKEEYLLLSGLTNQELLSPWLKEINKTKTPLSGILSLPLVSEGLMDRIESEHKCVILVSQQVPSNLRQSVFIDGKLILSRLVPIASFYQGDYATDVVRDIESTQRYLASQRLIDRNDVISVHMLCNKRHFEKLTTKCAGSTEFDYHIHDVNDFIEQEKIIVGEEQDFSSAIFCHLATKKLVLNHYAKASEKKYFFHYVGGLAANFASVVLVTLSLGMLGISVVKGYTYDASVSEMKLLGQKYQSKYNQLLEQKVDSKTSTTSMKNVVQTVDQVKQHYLFSPREMMEMVSQDISLFPDMRLSSLEWFVANSADADEAEKQLLEQGSSRRGRQAKRRNPANDNALYEIVEVEGELLGFDGDYRYALSVINDIEDTMKVSNKYHSVVITKRPLDIESDKSISGDVSQKTSESTLSKKQAEFAFKVVREVNLSDK